MPTAYALDVKVKVVIGDVAAQRLFEALTVVTVARRRDEIVERRLRVWPTDKAVDARKLGERKMSCRGFSGNTADAGARPKRIANIEKPRPLSDLEPEISGKALIGPLARECDLITLRVHFARESKQARARRVEHRDFRGGD